MFVWNSRKHPGLGPPKTPDPQGVQMINNLIIFCCIQNIEITNGIIEEKILTKHPRLARL